MRESILGIWAISGIIAGYFSYKEGKRKEDDIVVRKKLLDEIGKSKEYLTNIVDETLEKNDVKGTDSAKKVIDELGIFSTEVDLSETGHRYPFFSIQKSINAKALKKLINYDSSLLRSMEAVTETCKRIENITINNENVDLVWELKKARQHVTTARNEYKNRKDYIKRLK